MTTMTPGRAKAGLARRDLKVEAGFLMVNVEALTIVKLELKPCETSDIEDDLVLKDGDEHVLLEIQPSPTSLRKLDHFEVFTSTPMFAGLRILSPLIHAIRLRLRMKP